MSLSEIGAKGLDLAVGGGKTAGSRHEGKDVTTFGQNIDGKYSLGAIATDAFSTIVETNEERAAEMAAHMKVGSEATSEEIQNMVKGAEFLDSIWRGESKESFLDSLNELNTLIQNTSSDLNALGETIENENNITLSQHNKMYRDADNIYYGNRK